ncbi:hypothetical protein VP01_3822g2 [Puccinia sorghi]|uniref:Uncharacterized protein n=1 Tax=Puccinia sorghi TaxID=27349 RepID=A0A0L6UT79_9BASI|nr:hypothetical protein VP01_3822g2 [Puccinia sorghi]
MYTLPSNAVFDALQINFQVSMNFCQINPLNFLVDLKTSPPPTDVQSLQLLFNKIFKFFIDLSKVKDSLIPLVESLSLQVLVPAPPNISHSQLLQNISTQLSGKEYFTACDVHVIINSAYGESTQFDTPQSSLVLLLHMFHNPPSNSTNSFYPSNNPHGFPISASSTS